MCHYSLKVKPGLREESRYFRGSRSSSGGGGGVCGSAENKTKIKRAKLQFRFSHCMKGPICRRWRRVWGKKEKKEASKLATSNRCLFQCENTGGRFTALLEEAHPCVFVFFFLPSVFFPAQEQELVAYTRSQAVRGTHLNSRALTMRGTALLRPVASPLTFDMRDQDLSCRLQLIAAGMNSKRIVRSFVGPFLISQLTFFLFLLGLSKSVVKNIHKK